MRRNEPSTIRKLDLFFLYYDAEPQKPDQIGRVLGQASLDALAANAEEDRISSKQTYLSLKFAPSLSSAQNEQADLWITRFNFSRTNTLKHDLAQTFTAEHMIRFLFCILSNDPILEAFRPLILFRAWSSPRVERQTSTQSRHHNQCFPTVEPVWYLPVRRIQSLRP